MQSEIELIQDLEKISRWEQLDITMFVNLFRRIGLGSERVLQLGLVDLCANLGVEEVVWRLE